MIKKVIIGALAIIGALYSLMLIGVHWLSDHCNEDLKSAVTSPNDKFIARHYQKICENKPSLHEVSLYTKDKNMGYIIFSAASPETQEIKMTWLHEKELLISYPFSLLPERDYWDKEVGEVYVKYEYYK